MNDRFIELQCFVEVAREKSFTKAGESLRLAKSAISRRIRNLEERLGVQLISRTTRQVILTEAGTLFLDKCVNILEQLYEAETLVADSAKIL